MIPRPEVTRISVYPIKSLPGLLAIRSEVSVERSLRFDRTYRLVREDTAKYLSRKREVKLHVVEFYQPGGPIKWSEWTPQCSARLGYSIESTRRIGDLYLPTHVENFERDLSELLGYKVRLEQGYFPDDSVAHGPTLISQATLEGIGGWFGISEMEVHNRLRMNIVLGGEGEPFWEDRLVGKKIRFGKVVLQVTTACRRCVVPTRNSRSGVAIPEFIKRFIEKRKEHLVEGGDPAIYGGNFYRAGLNTIVLEDDGRIEAEARFEVLE